MCTRKAALAHTTVIQRSAGQQVDYRHINHHYHSVDYRLPTFTDHMIGPMMRDHKQLLDKIQNTQREKIEPFWTFIKKMATTLTNLKALKI